MSEQEQTSQEEVVAQQPDQEEAAMQAAIAESRGQEPQESPEPEQEEPPAEVVPDEPRSLVAGMTEEQVKELLVKAGKVDQLEAQVRNVFGRFGEMNSRIQQLQKTEPHLVGNAKELAGQYHEALLEGDVEKASELFVQMRQVGASESGGADFTEALNKQDQKIEEKLLRMRHPDWEAVTKTTDFNLWTQTLPEQERATLASTWDAIYIAEKIDEFKAAKKKADIPPENADQQRQQLTRRLENAVTPQGSARAAPPVVTEEEAMQAAIRARIRPRTT